MILVNQCIFQCHKYSSVFDLIIFLFIYYFFLPARFLVVEE